MTDLATVPAHPAPYSPQLLPIFAEALTHYDSVRVLDPFAGIGRIHDVRKLVPGVVTRGVELLPKWAAAHPGTIVGDATTLPARWTGRFDAVVTSPCYGNRMADHHDANDACKACGGSGEGPFDLLGDRIADMYPKCKKCKGSGLSHRRSYRHYYGDGFWTDANPAVNAGAMQWGEQYRALHEAAWREALRVLKPGGILVLNIKDHYRKGARVRVSDWHRRTILRLGFVHAWTYDVHAAGYRNGANRETRSEHEKVYVFEAPEVKL